MALLVTRDSHGHRREYAAVLSRVVPTDGEPVSVVARAWLSVFSAQPIMFLMIEDSPFEFFVLAFLRAIIGLRTVGLLFRAGECLYPTSLRLTVKRLLLRMLRPLPRSAVITLFPHSIEPRFSEIARYGINDPQFWDISDLPASPAVVQTRARVVSEVDLHARGRRVLIALGRQDREKAFEYFCRIWLGDPQLQKEWLFVAAGKIDSRLRGVANEFEAAGGMVIDRFIEDDELRALYDCADIVWGCYAPDYDQSSGIFGRAIQLGVMTTARSGSYIAKIADRLEHPCLPLPWGDPKQAGAAILRATIAERIPCRSTADMRASSIATLSCALEPTAHRARSATGRAIWNILEVAATALSLFMIYKLVVVQLGIASLGIYSLVLATTVFARVGDLGMAAGLVRFVARAGARCRTTIAPVVYVETALVANFLLYALLGAALLWPLTQLLQWAVHDGALLAARQLLPYAVFNFMLFNLANVSASALIGFHRSDLKSAMGIVALLLLLLLSWLTIPVFGLVGIALGQMAQNGFVAVAGWYTVRRLSAEPSPRVPWRIHVAALKEMLKFGLRLQLTNIVSLAYEPATKFVLSALAGPFALGLFELAYRVVVQTRALILAPSQNLTPMFAALSPSNVSERQRLYDNGVVLFVVAGGLGLMMVIVASPLISMFLVRHVSVVFVESVILLALGWFANIVSEPAYLLAIADGRTRWNTTGTVVASLGSPLLGFVLWHIAAVLGIVAGFAIATASAGIVVLLANARAAGLAHSFPSRASWHDWYRHSTIRFGSLLALSATETGDTAEAVPVGSEP